MATQSIFLKVVILGKSNVGKTSVLQVYVGGHFTDTYHSTIGADFLTKTVSIGKRTVVFQIWDTAGQERFSSLGTAYYRGADACILMYDVTSWESFQAIPDWKEDFLTKSGCDEQTLFILGANKIDTIDSERKVSIQQGLKCAGDLNLVYFEISAKYNIGIYDMFNCLVKYGLTNQKPKPEPKLQLTEVLSEPCSC